MKLDIGGGPNPLDGYVNVDPSYGHPENRCWLGFEPLPFPDGSIDEIHASHVFEHIPAGHPRISAFNDCYRVLRPGTFLDIRVPHFPHPNAIGDPTHVSFFVPESFIYFTQAPPAGCDFDVWELTKLDPHPAPHEGIAHAYRYPEIRCILWKPHSPRRV